MAINKIKTQIVISLFYSPCEFMRLMEREFIRRISPLCITYLLDQLQDEGLVVLKNNSFHAVKKNAKKFFTENNIEI